MAAAVEIVHTRIDSHVAHLSQKVLGPVLGSVGGVGSWEAVAAAAVRGRIQDRSHDGSREPVGYRAAAEDRTGLRHHAHLSGQGYLRLQQLCHRVPGRVEHSDGRACTRTVRGHWGLWNAHVLAEPEAAGGK